MKTALLYLFAFTFSIKVSFAQESSWTYKDRSEFIVECVKAAKDGMSEDSAKYYCYCMMAKVEARYPNPDDAAKLDASVFDTPEWKKSIQGCLGGYWTPFQRKDFISSCIEAAKPGIGEEKATSYCDCMMYKLENRYHSYAEASKLTTEQLQSPEWKKIIKSCLQ